MGRLPLGCRAFASLGHAEALGRRVGRTKINCDPHYVDKKTEEQRRVENVVGKCLHSGPWL